MPEIGPFETALAAQWPPTDWSGVTTLVAVSGGADSVALLRGLARLKIDRPGRLVVAHFDHRLRGQAGEEDARFVAHLAESLGLECHIGRAEANLVENRGGEGLEGAARKARYSFLTSIAQQVGARYLVTAHTAGDQVETILQRIFRGTGIRGLSGIARCRTLSDAVTLIRPMLKIDRSTIEAYLDSLGQPYRTDVTNGELKFTRNRIRHQLLPLAEELFGDSVGDSIARLGRLAAESQAVIDRLLDTVEGDVLLGQNSDQGGDLLELDCGPLAGCSPYLVRELFIRIWQRHGWPQQSMGLDRWEQIARIAIDQESAAVTFPGNIQVSRAGQRMSLKRL
jgi:tRNA(Ile)-lysidine synthase